MLILINISISSNTSTKNTDTTISISLLYLYSRIHFDQVIVLLKLQRSILCGASYVSSGSYPLSSTISYAILSFSHV